MGTKTHATLSASSADRWLHCPPSARLAELYEDKGSDFAAEGTEAHALAEYKLCKALDMQAEDPTENLSWFNEEMSDCTDGSVFHLGYLFGMYLDSRCCKDIFLDSLICRSPCSFYVLLR